MNVRYGDAYLTCEDRCDLPSQTADGWSRGEALCDEELLRWAGELLGGGGDALPGHAGLLRAGGEVLGAGRVPLVYRGDLEDVALGHCSIAEPTSREHAAGSRLASMAWRAASAPWPIVNAMS